MWSEHTSGEAERGSGPEPGKLNLAGQLDVSHAKRQCGNELRSRGQPSLITTIAGTLRHQFDINMDNLRGSLSGFKKDIKHQLGRGKRGGDKPGPSEPVESVGSSGSLPQPESRVSTGGGREKEGDGPETENENGGVSAATVEKRPGWKSTASSSAKLVLRGVRDSADAFGPLKSVAGGLCFILENCEVGCLPS